MSALHKNIQAVEPSHPPSLLLQVLQFIQPFYIYYYAQFILTTEINVSHF
jgi:hypothetical protein